MMTAMLTGAVQVTMGELPAILTLCKRGGEFLCQLFWL